MKSSENWQKFNKGISKEHDLESIHGYSDNEMYVVGGGGIIYIFDGEQWKLLQTPTNQDLNRVICAPDGFVYAIGANGIMLKGRNDKWEIIETNVSKSLWGIAWYKNSLYISSMSAVYKLIGDELEAVDFGEDKPSSFYVLSSCDEVIWTVGSSDIMSYDGEQWSRIV